MSVFVFGNSNLALLSERMKRLTLKKITGKRLIICAVVFHCLITLAVVTIGRRAVLPNTFDANGTAVGLAPDGIKLQKQAVELGGLLRHGEFRQWLLAWL